MSSNPDPGRARAEGERLQKVLAAAGIASRRAAEEMIAAGRVRVDGAVVTEMGRRVDARTARIEVDGKRIGLHPDHEYVLLNKPEGVITSAKDTHGRPTVLDLVESERRLFPVGRLDAGTVGVLLLTTDGELAHRLAHPRYEVEREYVAEVQGRPTDRTLRRLREGVELEDGMAVAKRARLLGSSGERSQIELVMVEGRKREVRRMLEAVGHPVARLARTRFGMLHTGTLAAGQWRVLTPAEVGELLASVGL